MAVTRLLVVSDISRSKKWYEEVLGANVTGEYGVTSVVLDLIGNWILLVTGGGPTDDKPTVTFEPPAHPDRVSAELIFRVPDCREAYELLKKRGADFLTPPVEMGRETRAFFRDLDGHLFEISEFTE